MKLASPPDERTVKKSSDDEALRVASATVRELLGHMKVRAEVNARYSDP
jgi:hypothetical protein